MLSNYWSIVGILMIHIIIKFDTGIFLLSKKRICIISAEFLKVVWVQYPRWLCSQGEQEAKEGKKKNRKVFCKRLYQSILTIIKLSKIRISVEKQRSKRGGMFMEQRLCAAVCDVA